MEQWYDSARSMVIELDKLRLSYDGSYCDPLLSGQRYFFYLPFYNQRAE